MVIFKQLKLMQLMCVCVCVCVCVEYAVFVNGNLDKRAETVASNKLKLKLSVLFKV